MACKKKSYLYNYFAPVKKVAYVLVRSIHFILLRYVLQEMHLNLKQLLDDQKRVFFSNLPLISSDPRHMSRAKIKGSVAQREEEKRAERGGKVEVLDQMMPRERVERWLW